MSNHKKRNTHVENQLWIRIRAGLDWAKVKKRSITSLVQTMLRRKAFVLKKYIKIIHLKPLASHCVKAQKEKSKGQDPWSKYLNIYRKSTNKKKSKKIRMCVKTNEESVERISAKYTLLKQSYDWLNFFYQTLV